MGTSGNTTDQALTLTADDADAELAQLDSRHRDRLIPIAKGIVGACPVIGPMLAEVVGMAVPNQRVERILTFARTLDERVRVTEDNLDRIKVYLRTDEGIDLLEDGITQSARAVTSERQQRIAYLIANALTGDELRYQESKKLLNILREITDPEIMWLIYYSVPSTLGSDFHQRLRNTHPEIFDPVYSSYGASQNERDRGALQNSYKNTLIRFGLLEEDRSSLRISYLGEMLVRAIEPHNEKFTA